MRSFSVTDVGYRTLWQRGFRSPLHTSSVSGRVEGFLAADHNEDIAFFTMWGTTIGCLFMFLFSRSWSGLQSRAMERDSPPGDLLVESRCLACCGIAMGLIKLDDEAPPFVLGGILLQRGYRACSQWFVPVAALSSAADGPET